MKKFLPYILVFFIITSCKTISIKNKETFGKIIFKNLKNKSEKTENALITGLFRISGVEEIPSAFLKFESFCFFNEKKIYFRMSFINNVIADIIIDKNKVLFLNHIGEEYVEYNIEQVDFSKFTGANFNPLDISYFFIGNIPFSENMELIDFKWQKKEYIMNITDNISKYTITLNRNEQITKVQIFNQYFDNLILDSIIYRDESNGEAKKPYKFDFLTENKKIKISFILKNISIEPPQSDLEKFKIPKKYKKVSSIEKIKIDFKGINKKK